MRLARTLVLLVLACLVADAPVHAGRFEVSNEKEARDIVAKVQAAHFLSHTTFGPTMDEIEALAKAIKRRGYSYSMDAWIDRQIAKEPSNHVPLAIEMLKDNGYEDFETVDPAVNMSRRFRYDAWWHNAIAGEDQLRQRVAWALSQIFVVNDFTPHNSSRMEPTDLPRYAGYNQYYDIFVNHAFGNYRDVLGEVTRHPIMGFFLTHLNNRKADPDNGIYPDENYARECMQLFTLGLYKVKDLSGEFARDSKGDLIPTYDNEDITTMARVFTGFTFDSSGFNGSQRYTLPMKMYNTQHDRTRQDPKVMLDGTVLNVNNRGLQDVNEALDMLIRQDETAPFVSRLLIQRLTHSNPRPDYLEDVAEAFAGVDGSSSGTRGDLTAVIKTIFTRGEASALPHTMIRDDSGKVVAVEFEGRDDPRTHLREPVLRYAAFIRAFGGSANGVKNRFHLGDTTTKLNQSPFKSPSVFNFYSPDFQPSGPMVGSGLVAPEFEIFTSVSANRLFNAFRDDIVDAKIQLGRIDGNDRFITLDFSDAYRAAGSSNSRTYQRTGVYRLMEYLDLLLCHGSLSEATKTSIVQSMLDNIPPTASERSREEGVRSAILLVLTAPDCAIAD